GVELDAGYVAVTLERMSQLGAKPELSQGGGPARWCWEDEVGRVKRQPDGRFRGNRSAIKTSNKILISHWVEREVLRLKRMGMSFETIADCLSRAGRGEFVPTVSLPEDVSFPPGYSISKMGACKAYRRRMEREPSLQAQEHRRLDTERLEELYLIQQPGIKQGERKAIDAALRILALKSKVVGYETTGKVELVGSNSAPLPITLVREVIARVEQEEDEEDENQKSNGKKNDQNEDQSNGENNN